MYMFRDVKAKLQAHVLQVVWSDRFPINYAEFASTWSSGCSLARPGSTAVASSCHLYWMAAVLCGSTVGQSTGPPLSLQVQNTHGDILFCTGNCTTCSCGIPASLLTSQSTWEPKQNSEEGRFAVAVFPPQRIQKINNDGVQPSQHNNDVPVQHTPTQVHLSILSKDVWMATNCAQVSWHIPISADADQ